MSLQELITQDLLDAAGDPVALHRVFDRHKASKGPMYAALGEATANLQDRVQHL